MNLWPLVCEWMRPGVACQLAGAPAVIVHKSIWPECVWIQRPGELVPERVSLYRVFPAQSDLELAPVELADPSVVLA